MKLSKQAMGALMMALQKSILEQEDIVPMLEDMDFELSKDNLLLVTNSPTVNLANSKDADFSDLEAEEV